MQVEINEREKAILKILIELHIKTSEPIGSRTLSKFDLGISAATIRNVLTELEEKDMVVQPHTSAGRIPTDRAYRFYLDELIDFSEVDEELLEKLKSVMDEENINFSLYFEKISRILAESSMQVGFILPNKSEYIVRKIDTLCFDDKIIVTMFFESGIIENVILKVRKNELENLSKEISNYFSMNVVGKSLSAFKENIKSFLEIENDKNRLYEVFKYIYGFISEKEKDIYLWGFRNIISQPEFLETGKMQIVLNILEEKLDLASYIYDLVKIAKASRCVRLGAENPFDKYQDFGFIMKKFGNQKLNGYLGLIGPRRMKYNKLIPLVELISKELTIRIKKY